MSQTDYDTNPTETTSPLYNTEPVDVPASFGKQTSRANSRGSARYPQTCTELAKDYLYDLNFVRTKIGPSGKILSELGWRHLQIQKFCPNQVSNHQFKGGKSSDEHVGGGIGAFDGFWHLKGLNAARRALTTDIGEVSYREVSSLTCRFLSELRLGFRLRRPDFVRTRGVSFWDFGPKFCPNLRQTSPPILGGPDSAQPAE
ncbi:hypothetical protein K435DRAFT_790029 [Dendrothele bispora CBS 962.96]|uniref:Uncharacterized protein n=1 Tax=Dendrothele bispora (strain CBS 962.96) TaxID=1314807 RepID=A0A4S8MRM9_DENBC|nr:hypothetical protein K435DRAFT_790029 [Dendrothele bispora CBS 962.96]